MQGNPAMDHESGHEWHLCNLILPRIGHLITRDGLRLRLLLPGTYLVRTSRTVGKRIYRRRPSHDWDD